MEAVRVQIKVESREAMRTFRRLRRKVWQVRREIKELKREIATLAFPRERAVRPQPIPRKQAPAKK